MVEPMCPSLLSRAPRPADLCMTWRSHGPGHRSAALPSRLWRSWLAAPPPARLADHSWLPALGEVIHCGVGWLA